MLGCGGTDDGASCLKINQAASLRIAFHVEWRLLQLCTACFSAAGGMGGADVQGRGGVSAAAAPLFA